jgi:Flp pilus assembly protein TadG
MAALRNTAIRRRLSVFGRETGGSSAVEFAIWLTLLAYPLVNIFDLGFYVYQRMEVENAAQMGAQASYLQCGQSYGAPSFTNCGTTGTNAVTNAAHSTSLTSSSVSVDTGEYLNNVKQTGSGGVTATPPSATGDYLAVQVSYPYAAPFSLATVTSLLSNPIVRTHWMRMN